MDTNVGCKPDGIFNGDGFLTKKEVASLLRVTTRTVDEYMRKGIIPFYKLSRTIRFKLADIEQHLRNTCRIAGHAA